MKCHQYSIPGSIQIIERYLYSFDGRHLACVAATIVALAQPVTAQAKVYGRVLDGEHRTPIANAEVLFSDLRQGALTNAEGGFLILRVPEGTHRVRVQVVGYDSFEKMVEVEGDSIYFEAELNSFNLVDGRVTEVVPDPDDRPAAVSSPRGIEGCYWIAHDDRVFQLLSGGLGSGPDGEITWSVSPDSSEVLLQLRHRAWNGHHSIQIFVPSRPNWRLLPVWEEYRSDVIDSNWSTHTIAVRIPCPGSSLPVSKGLAGRVKFGEDSRLLTKELPPSLAVGSLR